MRLIDADALKIDYGFTWSDITPTHDELYELINRQHTVDAVPVVRCRECKYYQTGMFCEKWADLHPHAEEYPMVCSNGFCHYSERKDGTEDV